MHEFLGGRCQVEGGHDLGGVGQLHLHRLTGDALLLINDQLSFPLSLPFCAYKVFTNFFKMCALIEKRVLHITISQINFLKQYLLHASIVCIYSTNYNKLQSTLMRLSRVLTYSFNGLNKYHSCDLLYLVDPGCLDFVSGFKFICRIAQRLLYYSYA